MILDKLAPYSRSYRADKVVERIQCSENGTFHYADQINTRPGIPSILVFVSVVSVTSLIQCRFLWGQPQLLLASRGCPVDNIRLGEVVLGVVYLEKELDLTIVMEKDINMNIGSKQPADC